MDLSGTIKEHLKTPRVMQLATSFDNQPWACNLHFYADDHLNIYWISTPGRRHSQEIAINPNVAASIMIHEDAPGEYYVMGISIEGTASLIDNEEVKRVGPLYAEKLKKPDGLIEDILSGKNPHRFYKLTPKKIVLFDTKNLPNEPRQELNL